MVDALSKVDFLRQMPAMSHFDEAALDRLADSAAPRFFKEGAHVYREGDPSDCVYALLRGGVRIEKTLPVGDVTLARFIQGEFFGDGDFVLESERYGNAVAETEVCVLLLKGESLARLGIDDPSLEGALYWAFWRSLTRRLRAANERLGVFFPGDNGGRSAEGEIPDLTPPNGYRISLSEKRQLFSEQKLSALEINLLSTMSKERKLEPGEVIFREGDPGDNLYLVLAGEVIVTKQFAGIGEEALAFLERGDIFGEMALIDDQPRSAGAKASDDGAVVVAVSGEVMREVLNIRRVSSLRLLKLLCTRAARRVRGSHDKLLGWQMLAGAPT